MAKTLRVLSRAGWITKPAADLPENKLTAADVDATLLDLWGLSMPVFRAVHYNGEPGSATTQIAAIQDAANAASANGGGVVVLDPGLWLIDASVLLGDNVTLHLLAGATLRMMPSVGVTCVSNADRVGGNAGCGIVGPGIIDGNKEAHANTFFYSTVDFMKVTDGFAIGARVRGGSRQVANENADGEGMVIRESLNFAVRGGKYYENNYDGIGVRGSRGVTISGAYFRNNDRSGVQLKHTNTAGIATYDCAVTNCVVEHSPGTITGGAPYISSIGFHRALRCAVSNIVAYGTHALVDMLEGASYNTVDNCVATIRPPTGNLAGLYLWDYNTTPCIGNRIRGVTLRGLSGAARRMVYMNNFRNGQISDCTFDVADGTGTWSVTETGLSSGNRLSMNREIGAVSYALGSATRFYVDTYGRPIWRGADGIEYNFTGAPTPPAGTTGFNGFSGASGAIPAGFTQQWVATNIAWTEDAGGFLRGAKTVAVGRAAISWDTPGALADVEVLTSFRTSAAVANGIYARTILRGAGAAGSETGYSVGLFLDSGGDPKVTVSKYVSGTASSVGSGGSFSATINTYYYLRSKIVGGNIKLWIWPVSDIEPSTPTYEVNDASPIVAAGWVGLMAYGIADQDWDYISFGEGGASAPLP